MRTKLFHYRAPIFLVAAFGLLAILVRQFPVKGELSSAIMVDLLVTIPVLYFLLVRKTKVPIITVVPVFIIGSFLGTLWLPASAQEPLQVFHAYVLPFLEFGVLGFVGFKAYRVIKISGGKQGEDVFSALKQTTQELIPQPTLANLLAMELAILYYGFLNWKKYTFRENEFSYHRKSSSVAILSILILIVGVETCALHVLMERWSIVLAWMLSVLSIYIGFQLFGIACSLSKRPVVVTDKELIFLYGILSKARIPKSQIKEVSLFRKTINKEDEIMKLSPLGDLDGHNLLVELHEPATLEGLYGRKKSFSKLALHLDEKGKFLELFADQH